MNKNAKKILGYAAGVLAAILLIAVAPISRTVYTIYDANRTKTILKQLEAEANNADNQEVNDFHKQAYVMQSQDAAGRTMDLLVLTANDTYELTHYEQVITASSSYTSKYFHMTGAYTRSGNVLTVEPGIGSLSTSTDGVGFIHYNAQYLTAEEAAGDKTRDEIYDMEYSSRQIALMQDGTFAVGGISDASDELGAPAGRNVYTDAVMQGRVTYKTLVVFDDGNYILYSQSTNSNNAEQTTGAFFGFSTYTIKDTDKGLIPDESKPEETYDIITGDVGLGFMYANNNGSHMQFDLQAPAQFSQWLATNFNAASPIFYVSESGFTIKLGALKTTVGHWGLYVPAADADNKEEENNTADIKLELESSAEGKPFILHLNADGTLTTGWTNYEQTLKSGFWCMFGDTLVLDLGDSGYTYSVNGDEITMNYGQMGDKVYTMTAEQLAAAKLNDKPITLEVETSAEGKPFILTFRADGTLTTGWTNYEQTLVEGSWSMEDGVLNAQAEGYTFVIVHNEDGSVSITVNYGQMGDKEYTLSAAALDALKAIPTGVQLRVESSAEGKPFILNFNLDGTVTTGWTNYEQTVKDGTWTVENGNLVIAVEGYEASVIVNADGSASVTVNYGQMGDKTYAMTAQQYASLVGSASGSDIQLEIPSSVEDKPFILYLNADGTVTTGWTNYAQTVKEGTWSAFGDTLIVDVEGYAASFAMNADGTADITVNYGQMGDKVYTLSAQQLEAAKANAKPIELTVESSAEGKPFILTFAPDGVITTGWTNYEQTVKEGSWKAESGALVAEAEGYAFTVAVQEDGTAVVTVNYGQMGDKEYTLSAAQLTALVSKAGGELHLEIASSAEGKPFVLDLHADGTVSTGWTNYEQTIKEGSWKVEEGKLVITVEGYTFDVTVKADGAADITVNYGQMGDKVYSATAEQMKSILG